MHFFVEKKIEIARDGWNGKAGSNDAGREICKQVIKNDKESHAD
jgi:hypothetical protein